jgi:metal-dependent hydrolase (beta-lactamase superfamily II)
MYMIQLIKLRVRITDKVVKEFKLLGDLDLIGAIHCIQYKGKIKELYQEKFIEVSMGKLIQM